MHQVVRRAVADTLGRGPAPELMLTPPRAGEPFPATLPLPASFESVIPSRWIPPSPHGGFGAASPASPHGGFGAASPPSPHGGFGAAGPPSPHGGFGPPSPHGGYGETRSGAPLRPMIPLGQFRDTFILAVDEEGIAIIDQHVAHERVLYERISERLLHGTLERQGLLEPLLVRMGAGGRDALRQHAADLERLGFEVEEFGGDTVKVTAFPAVLGRETCEATLRALAEDLEGFDRGAGAEAALKHIAATMACHAAVKANYPLTHEKMAHILEELRRTEYSTICPHGRPVMLRLTRREIEKNFQRI
jgi:DNA mismatch repair protein MutL